MTSCSLGTCSLSCPRRSTFQNSSSTCDSRAQVLWASVHGEWQDLEV